MSSKSRLMLLALAAAAAAGSTPGLAQEPHVHAPRGEQVGRVVFPISCGEQAVARFEQAVAMLHSFWFDAAQAAFQEVATMEPGCAMAYWGTAMTLLGNPMTRQSPQPQHLEAGLAAAQKAASLASGATARERGYIDAVVALFQDFATTDHMTRMRKHEEALRRVHEQHPDDPEAAIFYGRAIVANAPPDDLTFERQLAAGAMLEPLFQQQPDHPGLAHYIIHAMDAPQLADQGLQAAKRYSEIAPDAPHALHMPSHIFTRLGYWDESIELNQRSAQAEPNPDAAVHPMDYMVYAFLQQGRDRAAGEVVARAVQLPDRFYGGLLGYNFTAMPARYALERARWAEAARLPAVTSGFAYVQAISRFARAIGAARSGDAALAEQEVAALAALRDELARQNDAYWRTIVEAQRLAAAAWVALARSDQAGALRLAREAADLEETVEKHPVTPGPLLPARELEGDLLLELDRPADALRAYEKTLEREPRRARSLFGAGRAAQLAGQTDVARKRYAELLELMDRADPDRAEARVAREFLNAEG